MKLVTLVENTAPQPLAGEHGLSLYLETGGKRILFDAGQSRAFLDNAQGLGVDLTQADLAVLSHGHYDHGGGLPHFLAVNPRAMVYARPSAFDPHRNAAGRDIAVAALPRQRVALTEDTTPLAPGLTLVTLPQPPRDTGGMTARIGGQWLPEDFRHEQYLLAEEDGKRILISGCSHKGIVQIAEAFRPDVLVGGFHLMKVRDRDTLEALARRLLAGNTVYYTGHCTGAEQYALLKQWMGPRLREIVTGTVLEL